LFALLVSFFALPELVALSPPELPLLELVSVDELSDDPELSFDPDELLLFAPPEEDFLLSVT
jgi:hypothetical protein